MTDKDSFMVFSGTATRYLAEKICASLGCKLGNLQITKFSDGEFAVSYEESGLVRIVRTSHVSASVLSL